VQVILPDKQRLNRVEQLQPLLRLQPRARRLMARKALHDDPVELGWRMRREDRMVQITGEVREGIVHLLLPASEFLVMAG
jgi:hypothetical protein